MAEHQIGPNSIGLKEFVQSILNDKNRRLRVPGLVDQRISIGILLEKDLEDRVLEFRIDLFGALIDRITAG